MMRLLRGAATVSEYTIVPTPLYARTVAPGFVLLVNTSKAEQNGGKSIANSWPPGPVVSSPISKFSASFHRDMPAVTSSSEYCATKPHGMRLNARISIVRPGA